MRYMRWVQTNKLEFRLALTRYETAKALGVTPITVDRLVARGLLRPCRALRRPLFPRTEIERFLKETTAEKSKQCTVLYTLTAIGTTLAGSGVDAPQFMRLAIIALCSSRKCP